MAWRTGRELGCSASTSRVSEGSHRCGALSLRNSCSHISLCTSQLTMYPFSTGLRNTISPKSLHLSRSEPMNIFRVLSRARQFCTTSTLPPGTNPALRVYAPLSRTRVRGGGGGALAALDLCLVAMRVDGERGYRWWWGDLRAGKCDPLISWRSMHAANEPPRLRQRTDKAQINIRRQSHLLRTAFLATIG